MNLSIAQRFALIFALVVFVATATVGFTVYQGSRRALIKAATERLGHTSQRIEQRLASDFESIASDLRFLTGTPPVEGLVRTWSAGEQGYTLDRETGLTVEEWHGQLADLFRVFLENHPTYLQIGFASLYNNGQEILRLERHDDVIRRIPQEDLDQIGELQDFQRTIKLEEGTLYLSPITLESPWESDLSEGGPSLRAALPVYGTNGRVYGFLHIQIDMEKVFAGLREVADDDKRLYLANRDGYFLIHPDSTRTFGFERGQQYLIQDTFADVASIIRGEGSFLSVDEARSNMSEPVSAFFSRIDLGEGISHRPLILGVTAPHAIILADVKQVRNRSLLITLLFSLCGIIFALAFSTWLTRPLSKITRALSRFKRGEWGEALPVERQDEIGLMARTLRDMADEIQRQVIELESKELRQRTILETSAEGIIVADAEGMVETFNAAAEHILGYPSATVIGQPIDAYIQQASGKSATVADMPWLSINQRGEAVGLHKEGHQVPLLVTWSIFDLHGEQRVTILLHDITERKSAEALREKLLQELRTERTRLQQLSESLEERVETRTADLDRTNKVLEYRNRELQDFAYVASHDLQEPLRKIQAFSGLLISEFGGQINEDGLFYVDRMKDAAARMSRLISDLLAFSRITTQAKPYEEVDLNEIIEGVLYDLEIRLEETGGIVKVEPLPAIEADPMQMQQLFLNLISNGLKFHREDLPPVIHIRGCIEERGLLVGVDGEVCRFEIADNGIGFDEKYADRIFSPFQRLHGRGEYEGTGMGLAICRRIVERHDGLISVLSEPDKGTTFVVRLPVHQHAEAEEALAEEKAP
jgi:PAS domain S-box-containing protein